MSGAERNGAPATPLPVLRAADLPARDLRQPWLIERLWAEQGVGVVGGAPKCCKTWLALELAIAVASGRAALGRFAVPAPGPVLVYGAEDGPLELRQRLLAITTARAIALDALDLFLITAPSLRIDLACDRARLDATLERIQPRLLLLDPFVRLHRADENSAADMAALLGELRDLQRRHRLAVMLVHHLRKNAPSNLGGQALRGSGDLHAWGDSNLYLRKRDDHLALSVEHRAAPAPGPFRLLLAEQPAPHLAVVDSSGSPQVDDHDSSPDPHAAEILADRILALIRRRQRPLTRDAIRAELKVRNATLGDALARLHANRLVERGPDGFKAPIHQPPPVPVPTSTHAAERNARAEVETAGRIDP